LKCEKKLAEGLGSATLDVVHQVAKPQQMKALDGTVPGFFHIKLAGMNMDMDKFIHVYPTNNWVFLMLVGPKRNAPARSAATIMESNRTYYPSIVASRRQPMALQRSRLRLKQRLSFASAW